MSLETASSLPFDFYSMELQMSFLHKQENEEIGLFQGNTVNTVEGDIMRLVDIV